AAAQAGVTGMYAFKFSQTLWKHHPRSHEPELPQKTGFHFVSSDYKQGGTNDVTGATRGAEVVRLAAKGLKGARPRFKTQIAASDAKFKAVTCFDANSENYYIFSVNLDSR